MPRRLALVCTVVLTSCASDATSPAATSTEPATTATTTADTATATSTAPPAVEPTVRIVSQNILHGVGCPDSCRLPERVELFVRQLDDAGCPEVVAVQEANRDVVAALEPHLDTCGYALVWDDNAGIDRELALTTLPIVDVRRVELVGGFRTAVAVRVDAPFGALDVITTHLAADTDNGSCATTACPPACPPSDSLRLCQARQLVAFATGLAADGVVSVVGGDLNATASDGEHAILTAAGYVDAHLAAGRPECDDAHPESCTAGRASDSMTELTDPPHRQTRRIDHLFVDDGAPCELEAGTGPFNAEPAGGGIAWPSDHTGVMVELACDVASDDPPTFPSTTTTSSTTTTTVADQADEVAAITTAFETFFDGTADVDDRLAHLEDAERLRPILVAQLESVGDVAASTHARVESVTITSATSADVVFTILLDDAAVFEARTGTAVFDGTRWLVSAATFCELAALTSPDRLCVSA